MNYSLTKYRLLFIFIIFGFLEIRGQSGVFLDSIPFVCNLEIYNDYLYFDYIDESEIGIPNLTGVIARINLANEFAEPEILFETTGQVQGLFIHEEKVYYTLSDVPRILIKEFHSLEAKPDSLGYNLYQAAEIEVVDSKLYVVASDNSTNVGSIFMFDLEKLTLPPKKIIEFNTPWTMEFNNEDLFISTIREGKIYRTKFQDENPQLEEVVFDTLILPVGLKVVDNILYFTSGTGSDSFGVKGQISMVNLDDPNREIIPVYKETRGHHDLVCYNNYLLVAEPKVGKITRVYLPLTTNVNETNEIPLMIYPNPTSEYLYVQSINQGKFSILNSSGKLLFNAKLENSNKIDVSDFTPGFYIFHLENIGSAVFQITN